MKKLWFLILIVLLAMPCFALAADDVEEVIEVDIESGKVLPRKKAAGSNDLAYDRGESGYGKEGAAESQFESRSGRGSYMGDRKGHFRFGLIGPGYAVANKGAGSMMSMGVEGEYFFWDKLSAVMRIEMATDFDDITILSFVPRARYVFDLASHPRWALYVQGGVGLALWNGDHAAVDIAIPGGGFWWQWTDNWSIGADASAHFFVRSNTAIGFTIGPAIRYQF